MAFADTTFSQLAIGLLLLLSECRQLSHLSTPITVKQKKTDSLTQGHATLSAQPLSIVY